MRFVRRWLVRLPPKHVSRTLNGFRTTFSLARSGFVSVRLSAWSTNDNINLAQHDEKEDDVIFRPQVNFDAIWPITQLNTLRLDLGIGYSAYVMHPSNDTNAILISPGTQLAFDIFVGDFRINIHDRMSLQQDPISEPTISNTADYGRFENTAGISVLWDLNKVQATLGYDHYTFVSTTSEFDYINHNSEILSGSLSFAVASTTNIGLESTAVYYLLQRARA